MAKRPDVEASLPRSWEMRYIRTLGWNVGTPGKMRWMQQKADRFVDWNFNFKRFYRSLKADYGYFAGPIFFGIPALVIGFRGLKYYQAKLDGGKIRYRYRAPDHLRIPPEDIKQQPPWNTEHVAPLRQPETYTGVRKALEQGSRMADGRVFGEWVQHNTTPVPKLPSSS